MLAYDIEVLKAIPSDKETRIDGIEYCAGWHDHANLGISVICAFDWDTECYRVFCQDNFDEFQALVSKHKDRGIVSFNGVNFDDKVCAANGLIVESTYDILREMWLAAGLNPVYESHETHGGFGLDVVAKLNLGYGKTGYGGNAPVLWQQGQHGKVIDYCLHDVRLTRRLMERINFTRHVNDPREPEDSNRTVYLNMPKRFDQYDRGETKGVHPQS